MRLHVGLPKAFWANTINMATYLINQSPSVVLKFELQEEKWSGKKGISIAFENLWIYVICHMCMLDAKIKECIFIRYKTNFFIIGFGM